MDVKPYYDKKKFSKKSADGGGMMVANAAAGKVPHNNEAEQQVLGTILVDGLLGQEAVALITEDDFYNAAHACIFFHIKQLIHGSVPVDVVSLSDTMEKVDELEGIGSVQYLFDLYNKVASTANFKHYIDIVKRDGTLRRLIRACSEISENACSSVDILSSMALAEKKLFDITFEQDIQDLYHITEGVNLVLKETEELMRSPVKIKGVESGFKNLDNVTHGYKEGQMIVIAARPGCGKTSFAMNIATNIALAHPEKVVAVFNLEMSLSELTQRMLFAVSGVTQEMVYKGEDTNVFDKLWATKQRLDKTKLFVDDTAGATPEKIASKLRRLKQKQKRLDFVIIDYLQLLRMEKSLASLQHEVTEISRAIKLMAKELKVPILILSQTSRGLEKRDDKTPMLSDLRDSGSIEQDADQVYFLIKDESDYGSGFEVVNLNIIKNRSGSTAILPFKWEGSLTRFTDMDRITYEQLKEEAKLREKGESVQKAKQSSDVPPPDDNNAPPPDYNNAQPDDLKSVSNALAVMFSNTAKAQADKVDKTANGVAAVGVEQGDAGGGNGTAYSNAEGNGTGDDNSVNNADSTANCSVDNNADNAVKSVNSVADRAVKTRGKKSKTTSPIDKQEGSNIDVNRAIQVKDHNADLLSGELDDAIGTKAMAKPIED